MGFLTVKQAMVKYEIRSKQTIKNWIKLYHSDTPAILERPTSDSVEGEEQLEQKYRDVKFSDIENQLQQSRLKIVALETMIDVASMEYGIDIKKKPGTKQ